MVQYIKEYIVTFIVFLTIDAVWLGVISKKLYKEQLGYIMSDNVNFVAAGIFYILFIAGVIFFVVHPAVMSGSPIEALVKGAFLGLLCYATYDLTNLAALKDWPVIITVIDLAWGTFITAITSFAATLFITNFITKN